jgi:hypothetical protein
MVSEFTLNNDIFETNIINLSRVVRIVVTVVGENLDLRLTQRKKKNSTYN